jgi:hypothetical protein
VNGIGIQLPPWVMRLFFGYVAKHSYITQQGIWKYIKIKDPLILVFSKPQRTTMSKERTNNLFFIL